MVPLDSAGAVSRKSMVKTSEDSPGFAGGIRTVMNPPPPIPDLLLHVQQENAALIS
jgi:hypothetical protein